MITQTQEWKLRAAIEHEKQMNKIDEETLQEWADQHEVEDYWDLIDNEDAMMDEDYHMMVRIARRMELSVQFVDKLENILNNKEEK